jgi:hypothetical protein
VLVNGWIGRILLIVAALVGVRLALPPPSSAEVARVIPIVVSPSSPAAGTGVSGPTGAVDKVVDTSAGLQIEGWIAFTIESIQVVTVQAEKPQEQRVVLYERSDVEAAGYGLLTGFRTVFPGLEKDSVRCIVFVGQSGSVAAWPSGESCN